MELYSGDMLDFNITLRFIESIGGFTVREQSQNRYMMTSIFLVFFFKFICSLRNQMLLFTECYVIQLALQCDFTLNFLFTIVLTENYFSLIK